MDSDDKAQLQGIKGWLALLALYQVITVIKLTITFCQIVELYRPALGTPELSLLDYALLGIQSLALPVVYAATIALFLRKRAFKALLICQWLINPVIVFTKTITINLVNGDPVIEILESIKRGDAIMYVESFIVIGIWVLYTRKSKRVANTMVN